MTLNACLEEQIGRLVHPTAQASPGLAAQHRFFIETRLALGFAALGVLPFYLVAGGVPGVCEAAVLGCLLVPFVAVAVASGRGRLIEAEAIGAAGWVGLAATLAAGHLAGPGTAAALLVLVPLEASFGEGGPKLQVATIFAGVGALGVAALDGLHGSLAPWVLLLGVTHGALLCWRGRLLQRDATRRSDAQSRRDRQFEHAISDVVIRFEGAAATVANPRAVRPQFGLAADDLAGRGFFDRIHVADRPAFLRLLGEMDDRDGEPTLQLRFRTSAIAGVPATEPAYATIDLRMRRTPADHGDPRARFTTTAQVRLAETEPVRVADSGDHQPASPDEAWRDRLLANISHELRTPLNAIIGFSEMLASDTLAPQQPEARREYAGIIQASGQHLLGIVNSMLDLSKIDAGKFELAHEPFDVGDLLRTCCDMMRLKADEARVDVACRVEAGPLQLTADKRACRQVVLNLLSNALKFTPEYGRATVTARRDAAWLELVVADTGIGMGPQDMARLGDRFFQAQAACDRRFEGTGLGLSVVSGLVALHGGSISAESAPGQGTRMTVRLPLEAAGSAASAGKARIETVCLPSRPTVARGPLHPKVKKIA